MYRNVAPNFNAALFWSLAFNKFSEPNFEGTTYIRECSTTHQHRFTCFSRPAKCIFNYWTGGSWIRCLLFAKFDLMYYHARSVSKFYGAVFAGKRRSSSSFFFLLISSLFKTNVRTMARKLLFEGRVVKIYP